MSALGLVLSVFNLGETFVGWLLDIMHKHTLYSVQHVVCDNPISSKEKILNFQEKRIQADSSFNFYMNKNTPATNFCIVY